MSSRRSGPLAWGQASDKSLSPYAYMRALQHTYWEPPNQDPMQRVTCMSCTKCSTTVPEKRPAGYEAGARRLLCTLAQHSNAPGLVLAHHLCHEGLEVIDGLLALLQQPSIGQHNFLGTQRIDSGHNF